MPTITTDAHQALGIFHDMYAQGPDAFVEYCVHCGIPLDDLKNAGKSYDHVILAHYAVGPGEWDVDRISADMLRWPPLANRIAELKDKQRSKAERKKAREARIRGRA